MVPTHSAVLMFVVVWGLIMSYSCVPTSAYVPFDYRPPPTPTTQIFGIAFGSTGSVRTADAVRRVPRRTPEFNATRNAPFSVVIQLVDVNGGTVPPAAAAPLNGAVVVATSEDGFQLAGDNAAMVGGVATFAGLTFTSCVRISAPASLPFVAAVGPAQENWFSTTRLRFRLDPSSLPAIASFAFEAVLVSVPVAVLDRSDSQLLTAVIVEPSFLRSLRPLDALLPVAPPVVSVDSQGRRRAQPPAELLRSIPPPQHEGFVVTHSPLQPWPLTTVMLRDACGRPPASTSLPLRSLLETPNTLQLELFAVAYSSTARAHVDVLASGVTGWNHGGLDGNFTLTGSFADDWRPSALPTGSLVYWWVTVGAWAGVAPSVIAFGHFTVVTSDVTAAPRLALLPPAAGVSGGHVNMAPLIGPEGGGVATLPLRLPTIACSVVAGHALGGWNVSLPAWAFQPTDVAQVAAYGVDGGELSGGSDDALLQHPEDHMLPFSTGAWGGSIPPFLQPIDALEGTLRVPFTGLLDAAGVRRNAALFTDLALRGCAGYSHVVLRVTAWVNASILVSRYTDVIAVRAPPEASLGHVRLVLSRPARGLPFDGSLPYRVLNVPERNLVVFAIDACGRRELRHPPDAVINVTGAFGATLSGPTQATLVQGVAVLQPLLVTGTAPVLRFKLSGVNGTLFPHFAAGSEMVVPFGQALSSVAIVGLELTPNSATSWNAQRLRDAAQRWQPGLARPPGQGTLPFTQVMVRLSTGGMASDVGRRGVGSPACFVALESAILTFNVSLAKIVDGVATFGQPRMLGCERSSVHVSLQLPHYDPTRPQAFSEQTRPALLGSTSLLPVLIGDVDRPAANAFGGSVRPSHVSGWQVHAAESPPLYLRNTARFLVQLVDSCGRHVALDDVGVTVSIVSPSDLPAAADGSGLFVAMTAPDSGDTLPQTPRTTSGMVAVTVGVGAPVSTRRSGAMMRFQADLNSALVTLAASWLMAQDVRLPLQSAADDPPLPAAPHVEAAFWCGAAHACRTQSGVSDGAASANVIWGDPSWNTAVAQPASLRVAASSALPPVAVFFRGSDFGPLDISSGPSWIKWCVDVTVLPLLGRPTKDWATAGITRDGTNPLAPPCGFVNRSSLGGLGAPLVLGGIRVATPPRIRHHLHARLRVTVWLTTFEHSLTATAPDVAAGGARSTTLSLHLEVDSAPTLGRFEGFAVDTHRDHLASTLKTGKAIASLRTAWLQPSLDSLVVPRIVLTVEGSIPTQPPDLLHWLGLDGADVNATAPRVHFVAPRMLLIEGLRIVSRPDTLTASVAFSRSVQAAGQLTTARSHPLLPSMAASLAAGAVVGLPRYVDLRPADNASVAFVTVSSCTHGTTVGSHDHPAVGLRVPEGSATCLVRAVSTEGGGVGVAGVVVYLSIELARSPDTRATADTLLAHSAITDADGAAVFTGIRVLRYDSSGDGVPQAPALRLIFSVRVPKKGCASAAAADCLFESVLSSHPWSISLVVGPPRSPDEAITGSSLVPTTPGGVHRIPSAHAAGRIVPPLADSAAGGRTGPTVPVNRFAWPLRLTDGTTTPPLWLPLRSPFCAGCSSPLGSASMLFDAGADAALNVLSIPFSAITGPWALVNLTVTDGRGAPWIGQVGTVHGQGHLVHPSYVHVGPVPMRPAFPLAEAAFTVPRAWNASELAVAPPVCASGTPIAPAARKLDTFVLRPVASFTSLVLPACNLWTPTLIVEAHDLGYFDSGTRSWGHGRVGSIKVERVVVMLLDSSLHVDAAASSQLTVTLAPLDATAVFTLASVTSMPIVNGAATFDALFLSVDRCHTSLTRLRATVSSAEAATDQAASVDGAQLDIGVLLPPPTATVAADRLSIDHTATALFADDLPCAVRFGDVLPPLIVRATTACGQEAAWFPGCHTVDCAPFAIALFDERSAVFAVTPLSRDAAGGLLAVFDSVRVPTSAGGGRLMLIARLVDGGRSSVAHVKPLTLPALHIVPDAAYASRRQFSVADAAPRFGLPPFVSMASQQADGSYVVGIGVHVRGDTQRGGFDGRDVSLACRLPTTVPCQCHVIGPLPDAVVAARDLDTWNVMWSDIRFVVVGTQCELSVVFDATLLPKSAGLGGLLGRLSASVTVQLRPDPAAGVLTPSVRRFSLQAMPAVVSIASLMAPLLEVAVNELQPTDGTAAVLIALIDGATDLPVADGYVQGLEATVRSLDTDRVIVDRSNVGGVALIGGRALLPIGADLLAAVRTAVASADATERRTPFLFEVTVQPSSQAVTIPGGIRPSGVQLAPATFTLVVDNRMVRLEPNRMNTVLFGGASGTLPLAAAEFFLTHLDQIVSTDPAAGRSGSDVLNLRFATRTLPTAALPVATVSTRPVSDPVELVAAMLTPLSASQRQWHVGSPRDGFVDASAYLTTGTGVTAELRLYLPNGRATSLASKEGFWIDGVGSLTEDDAWPTARRRSLAVADVELGPRSLLFVTPSHVASRIHIHSGSLRASSSTRLAVTITSSDLGYAATADMDQVGAAIRWTLHGEAVMSIEVPPMLRRNETATTLAAAVVDIAVQSTDGAWLPASPSSSGMEHRWRIVLVPLETAAGSAEVLAVDAPGWTNTPGTVIASGASDPFLLRLPTMVARLSTRVPDVTPLNAATIQRGGYEARLVAKVGRQKRSLSIGNCSFAEREPVCIIESPVLDARSLVDVESQPLVDIEAELWLAGRRTWVASGPLAMPRFVWDTGRFLWRRPINLAAVFGVRQCMGAPAWPPPSFTFSTAHMRVPVLCFEFVRFEGQTEILPVPVTAAMLATGISQLQPLTLQGPECNASLVDAVFPSYVQGGTALTTSPASIRGRGTCVLLYDGLSQRSLASVSSEPRWIISAPFQVVDTPIPVSVASIVNNVPWTGERRAVDAPLVRTSLCGESASFSLATVVLVEDLERPGANESGGSLPLTRAVRRPASTDATVVLSDGSVARFSRDGRSWTLASLAPSARSCLSLMLAPSVSSAIPLNWGGGTHVRGGDAHSYGTLALSALWTPIAAAIVVTPSFREAAAAAGAPPSDPYVVVVGRPFTVAFAIIDGGGRRANVPMRRVSLAAVPFRTSSRASVDIVTFAPSDGGEWLVTLQARADALVGDATSAVGGANISVGSLSGTLRVFALTRPFTIYRQPGTSRSLVPLAEFARRLAASAERRDDGDLVNVTLVHLTETAVTSDGAPLEVVVADAVRVPLSFPAPEAVMDSESGAGGVSAPDDVRLDLSLLPSAVPNASVSSNAVAVRFQRGVAAVAPLVATHCETSILVGTASVDASRAALFARADVANTVIGATGDVRAVVARSTIANVVVVGRPFYSLAVTTDAGSVFGDAIGAAAADRPPVVLRGIGDVLRLVLTVTDSCGRHHPYPSGDFPALPQHLSVLWQVLPSRALFEIVSPSAGGISFASVLTLNASSPSAALVLRLSSVDAFPTGGGAITNATGRVTFDVMRNDSFAAGGRSSSTDTLAPIPGVFVPFRVAISQFQLSFLRPAWAANASGAVRAATEADGSLLKVSGLPAGLGIVEVGLFTSDGRIEASVDNVEVVLSTTDSRAHFTGGLAVMRAGIATFPAVALATCPRSAAMSLVASVKQPRDIAAARLPFTSLGAITVIRRRAVALSFLSATAGASFVVAEGQLVMAAAGAVLPAVTVQVVDSCGDIDESVTGVPIVSSGGQVSRFVTGTAIFTDLRAPSREGDTMAIVLSTPTLPALQPLSFSVKAAGATTTTATQVPAQPAVNVDVTPSLLPFDPDNVLTKLEPSTDLIFAQLSLAFARSNLSPLAYAATGAASSAPRRQTGDDLPTTVADALKVDLDNVLQLGTPAALRIWRLRRDSTVFFSINLTRAAVSGVEHPPSSASIATAMASLVGTSTWLRATRPVVIGSYPVPQPVDDDVNVASARVLPGTVQGIADVLVVDDSWLPQYWGATLLSGHTVDALAEIVGEDLSDSIEEMAASVTTGNLRVVAMPAAPMALDSAAEDGRVQLRGVFLFAGNDPVAAWDMLRDRITPRIVPRRLNAILQSLPRHTASCALLGMTRRRYAALFGGNASDPPGSLVPSPSYQLTKLHRAAPSCNSACLVYILVVGLSAFGVVAALVVGALL